MTYESFFGMSNTPFVRNIPVSCLYTSPILEEAMGRLKYTADGELFAVLTADSGCGKSTLIRRFAASLPHGRYQFLYLSDSKLTPRWLYKNLLDQLGLDAKFYRGDAKRQFQKEIGKIHEVQHKHVVCVLDEAHLLEKETLEEFRFLLNTKYDSESPMALILAGQTELWEQKLRLKRYSAITERIDISCVLPHLDRAETARYITSHLKYSGCGQELFTDNAIDDIFRLSSGIPRMVNRLCDKSLSYACQQKKRLVDDHMVRYVSEHEMLVME